MLASGGPSVSRGQGHLYAGALDDHSRKLAAGVFTVLEGVGSVDEHVVDTL